MKVLRATSNPLVERVITCAVQPRIDTGLVEGINIKGASRRSDC